MNRIKILLLSFLSLSIEVRSSEFTNLDKIPEQQDRLLQEIYTCPEIVQHVYQIAKDYTDVLTAYGVPYTIVYGSQMGAQRHGGLIPWDDDFDTGILESDLEKLVSLTPLFAAMGYQLIPDSQELVGYKFESIQTYPIKLSDTLTIDYRPFVDVFVFQKQEDKYVLKAEKGRSFFLRSWYFAHEFEPRCTFSFGPLTLAGLANADTALQRQYGAEWNTVALYYFNHHQGVKGKYVWKLRDQDRIPITVQPLRESWTNYRSLVSEGTVFTLNPNGYLETELWGENWIARNATAEDAAFVKRIYKDDEIMKWYGAGSCQDDTDIMRQTLDLWLPRFASGQPHGGLIVESIEDRHPLGFVMGGYSGEPGVASIAYAYTSDVWGKGIGSSVLATMANQWAHEVKRIGFRSYVREPLKRFDGTVSPENVASIRLLEKTGFTHAQPSTDTIQIDLSQNPEESQEVSNQKIMDLYNSSLTTTPLARGVRYALLDSKGNLRCFSVPEKYLAVKYHFSLNLD
jgi:RimJ/RimL family protein N-acetyltransferase